jgi:hypothetical protein
VDAKKVEALKKEIEDLNTSMQIFKPRMRLGFGVGPKGAGDGIESKITAMAKRKLAQGQIDKQKAELIRMAYINIVMADVAKAYPHPKPKVAGKGAKEWNSHSDEMKKTAQELIEALKKGDAGKIKTAALNLESTCTNCHTDFRD